MLNAVYSININEMYVHFTIVFFASFYSVVINKLKRSNVLKIE